MLIQSLVNVDPLTRAILKNNILVLIVVWISFTLHICANRTNKDIPKLDVSKTSNAEIIVKRNVQSTKEPWNYGDTSHLDLRVLISPWLSNREFCCS